MRNRANTQTPWHEKWYIGAVLSFLGDRVKPEEKKALSLQLGEIAKDIAIIYLMLGFEERSIPAVTIYQMIFNFKKHILAIDKNPAENLTLEKIKNVFKISFIVSTQLEQDQARLELRSFLRSKDISQLSSLRSLRKEHLESIDLRVGFGETELIDFLKQLPPDQKKPALKDFFDTSLINESAGLSGDLVNECFNMLDDDEKEAFLNHLDLRFLHDVRSRRDTSVSLNAKKEDVITNNVAELRAFLKENYLPRPVIKTGDLARVATAAGTSGARRNSFLAKQMETGSRHKNNLNEVAEMLVEIVKKQDDKFVGKPVTSWNDKAINPYFEIMMVSLLNQKLSPDEQRIALGLLIEFAMNKNVRALELLNFIAVPDNDSKHSIKLTEDLLNVLAESYKYDDEHDSMSLTKNFFESNRIGSVDFLQDVYEKSMDPDCPASEPLTLGGPRRGFEY